MSMRALRSKMRGVLVLLSLMWLQRGEALPARPYRRTAFASQDDAARSAPGGDRVGWMTARLDHFSADTRTFQQRFFINASLYKPGGPVFLCVGGEGPPMTEAVVVSGELHCALMVHLAAQHSALILALEHRYYGASQPLPDLSTSNLRFLSSRQALQDIALFHEHATALMELPASTKWVAFGGSYPGMLAAWSRSKFPHLFHAAVSSSAPVEAILNMRGYNDVTAASLADSLVGGSKACLAAVQSAFAVLGSKLETAAGRRELERDLNACGGPGMRTLEDAGARALLAEGAADPLIPQSNDPACTSSPVCDIRGQCRMLTNDSIGLPYERLVELNRVARGGACLDANFTAMVEALRSVEVSDDRTDRVWFYQTCTEFAFYQTCDPDSACPFTSQPHINTLESYTGLCKQVFDIDAAAVASFVKETNAVYGGRSIRASRVLWVNGIIDPWRAQAVTKSPDPKLQPVLLVPGASHHFWTHPPQPTDSLYVVKARLQIADFVSKALAEPVADLFKGERAVARGSERAGQKHYTSDPTDWMLDNKRLPGVPLSPFQAVG